LNAVECFHLHVGQQIRVALDLGLKELTDDTCVDPALLIQDDFQEFEEKLLVAADDLVLCQDFPEMLQLLLFELLRAFANF